MKRIILTFIAVAVLVKLTVVYIEAPTNAHVQFEHEAGEP